MGPRRRWAGSGAGARGSGRAARGRRSERCGAAMRGQPRPARPQPRRCPRRALAMEPGTIDNLCILYQSPDFIVVNKHWDIRIDSKMWYETLTLQSQLKHRFPELADPDTYYGFR